MSDEEPTTEPEDSAPPEGGFFGKLRAWTGGGGRRNTIILAAFGVVAVFTVVAWLALADLAVQSDAVTIEMAFEALDAGEEEFAKGIVEQLQENNALSVGEYGGPLFVLGAVKILEADRQWSPGRSRTEHLIASKYLSEARTIGWPEGRKAEGLFLLGKSLIESRQLTEGIEVLHDALAAGPENSGRARLLLAKAYFYAPSPRYADSIVQIDTAIADPALPAALRAEALLLKAEAFSALGQGEEAARTISEAEAQNEADPARLRLVEGKSLVAQIEKATNGTPAAKPEKVPAEILSLAARATAALERARRLDKLATPISRESGYLKARVEQLLGHPDKALESYRELRRNQGASPAGIAAAIAEADLYRRQGDTGEALESYRRALDALGDPKDYRGSLLPISVLRQRVREAHTGFLEDGQHQAAIDLVEWIHPLLSRTNQLQLRAETLQQWGNELIAAAEPLGKRGDETIHIGRHRLREAGVAYEQLAEARYATRGFTDDLWASADCFYLGQSYAGCIRVLERYLRNEPEQRNALALLRLGESRLARGEDNAAIASLEECLEFHPTDVSSYRARLECAKAYRMQNQPDKAESLLRYNLLQTAMTPASPEWRDSKFELGELLAEGNKHVAAIRELEEAVDRYPDDPQSRLGRYLIAEAYRRAAQEPLDRLVEAKTVNDRERNREEARGLLVSALSRYQDVQNEITLANSGDGLDRATLRNCYMLSGEVQFELGHYEEAIRAYSEVNTLYQNEPFVLETLVQISHCWRRLKDKVRASGAIQQAKLLLTRLPADADFASSTNLTRAEWSQLLDRLAQF